MRIDQLKYFLEIARLGSINAASQYLFISQQGISSALKQLEKEFDTTFFIRSKKGITLNSLGEQVLPIVERIINDYNQFENSVLQYKETSATADNHKHFSLLVNPLSLPVFVPDIMDLLSIHHSELDIHCRDTASLEEMISQIENGKANLCIFMLMDRDTERILNTIPPSITVDKLFSDELVACVSKHSKLSRKKFLSPEELDHIEKILCESTYLSQGCYEVENISNNIDFQLKLILKKEIAAITTRYFFPRTFPTTEVKALQIKPSLKTNYFCMYSSTAENNNLISILNTLHQYSTTLSGKSTN